MSKKRSQSKTYSINQKKSVKITEPECNLIYNKGSYWYHGTSTSNLLEIKNEGLRSSQNKNWVESESDKIYLTRDLKEALNWGLKSEARFDYENGDWIEDIYNDEQFSLELPENSPRTIILRVKEVSNLTNDTILSQLKYSSEGSRATNLDIPSNTIEICLINKWMPLSDVTQKEINGYIRKVPKRDLSNRYKDFYWLD